MATENIYENALRQYSTLFGKRDDMREVKRRLQTARDEEEKRIAKGVKLELDDRVLLTDAKLYAPHVNVSKVESALKENGLEIVLIRDSASKLLPRAYVLSAQNFPVTEIDPADVWASCIEDTGKGIVFDSPTGEKVYLRYVCAGIVDTQGRFGEKGGVIAAADGIFEANARTNTLYLSHIATQKGNQTNPELNARRMGIASALENAMLNVCHEFAEDAEKRLGASYKIIPSTGKKIHAMTLEIEFANLADEEGVKATVGRDIFHGINGVSVCEVREQTKDGRTGGVRYAQSDTTRDSYNSRTWTSVPLYLGVRLVGNEECKIISGLDARAYLDLMYDGFLSQGMPQAGVEADRAYSKIRIGRDVLLNQLPTNAKEAVAFVKDQGTAAQILSRSYTGHNFNKDLADYKSTIKAEQIVHYVR
ncbi:hypothetical protein HZA96_01385 [Candidatus Woesearchaeota archaeon]|nr:hypothetical protein [Candidatus Woesearchaeota archaeon]